MPLSLKVVSSLPHFHVSSKFVQAHTHTHYVIYELVVLSRIFNSHTLEREKPKKIIREEALLSQVCACNANKSTLAKQFKLHTHTPTGRLEIFVNMLELEKRIQEVT